MRVRRADVADLPAMFELGRAMRKESLIPFPEIDEQAMRDAVGLLGDLYFMAVAEAGGETIGMITAQVSRYMFSEEIFAMHDIFYVRPQDRGSGAGARLVRAFEDWAREIGARRAVIAIHTGLNPENTGRIYERLGFRFMGGNYMKEFD